MGHLRVLAIAAVISFAGCAKEYPVDRVTKVADDDVRMNAAIDKARATVDSFIAALQAPKPGQSNFTIKMAFSDETNTEHMWLEPVSFDRKTFHGTVSNVARTVKSVKMGQPAVVSPSEISDWMYLENGKIVGGHTIRVLRDTLTPSERADFDKEMKFIDE